MHSKSILVIEDEPSIAEVVSLYLRRAGYQVQTLGDGQAALEALERHIPDLVVMDLMLPGLDGLSIVRTIRGAGRMTPVLFLSTMSGIDDRVIGLNAGADDYLVKPFAFSELLARINALGRRPALVQVETVLRVADLEMDLLSRTVRRAGNVIDLQPREWQLLEYLVRNAGKVVTRTMLLENVWDYHFDPQTNVIDVHISRLRQKIEADPENPMIRTVRGAGYMLQAGD